VHAVLLFGWLALFVAQSVLAAKSVRAHRTMGLVGISLATAMVFTALLVIVDGLNQAVHNGTEASARVLSIVPMTAIGSFAVLFILAIANRQRTEYHKRLMVLATVALLAPAVARVLFVLFAPPAAGVRPSFANPVPDLGVALRTTFAPAFIVDLLILLPIVREWRTTGRPHVVYVTGAASLLALHIGRIFVATSLFWHTVTNGLIALAY